MIYFIRDASSGHVKIGFSVNPWKRLTYLQIGTPGVLRMAAVIAGEKEDEARLHDQFRAYHVRGEWFRWDGPVGDYVGALETVVALPVKTEIDRKRQILRAVEAQGFSCPYASQLASGARPWPLDIAIGVWRECGQRVGPLADASDEELAVLDKYAAHFRPSRPNRNEAA